MQENNADGLTWGHYGAAIVDAAREGNCDRIKYLADGVRMMAAAAEALRAVHGHLTDEQKEIVRTTYAEFTR